MYKKLLALICFIFVGFFYISPVYSQVSIDPSDFFIEINPEVPEPKQLVRARVASYVFNVDEIFIEWQENNQVRLSGIGEKVFQFSAGAIGETKVVTLILRNEAGGDVIYKKQIVSKPSGMDILWQASDSYTPPFYKGKALPAKESIIKIISLPTFQVGTQTVSPKNVIYNWKRNFEPVPQVSGYGKNVLSLKQNYLSNEERISVVANEPQEGSIAQGALVIKPYNPKIIFYKKDPLLGIDFNNPIIEDLTLKDVDVTVVAIPYFVSPKNIFDPDLTYTWTLNDSELNTPNPKNQLVLRGASEEGTADLELNIESAKKLFLEVTGRLTVLLSK